MKRAVRWFPLAVDDLRALPDWRIAAEADRVLEHFAATGRGFVVRLPNPGGADEYRLYFPPHPYYARIRYTDDVVYVERVLRSP